MKALIVPIAIWAYVLSAIFAKRLWGSVFDAVIRSFDASPNQAWVFPVILNSGAALIGVAHCIGYLVSLRKRDRISPCWHVSVLMVLPAIYLTTFVTIRTWKTANEHLTIGLREFIGGKPEQIFAAGTTCNDSYSNHLVGVSIKLPIGWHPSSLNSMRRAVASAESGLFGRSSEPNEATAPSSHPLWLFCMNKHPDFESRFSPTLTLSASNKSRATASGPKSLKEFADGITNVAPPFFAAGIPVPRRFGESSGFRVSIIGEFPGGRLRQNVYFAETEQYFLMLTASAMDEEDLKTMDKAAASLRFGEHNAATDPQFELRIETLNHAVRTNR